MIVLDTNLLSELGREHCDPTVLAWVETQDRGALWITSTTISELVLGVMQLPDGARKNRIDDANSQLIGMFYDRTLYFDGNAAVEYGRFVADRIASGRPIDRADAQIAASCTTRGAALATRNIKDFEGIPGLELIDPWKPAG